MTANFWFPNFSKLTLIIVFVKLINVSMSLTRMGTNQSSDFMLYMYIWLSACGLVSCFLFIFKWFVVIQALPWALCCSLVISINAFPIPHTHTQLEVYHFLYQHTQFQNSLKFSIVNNRQKVHTHAKKEKKNCIPTYSISK